MCELGALLQFGMNTHIDSNNEDLFHWIGSKDVFRILGWFPIPGFTFEIPSRQKVANSRTLKRYLAISWPRWSMHVHDIFENNVHSLAMHLLDLIDSRNRPYNVAKMWGWFVLIHYISLYYIRTHDHRHTWYRQFASRLQICSNNASMRGN